MSNYIPESDVDEGGLFGGFLVACAVGLVMWWAGIKINDPIRPAARGVDNGGSSRRQSFMPGLGRTTSLSAHAALNVPHGLYPSRDGEFCEGL